jgi:16S rRNA (adenine1518-N6/adenine1519-N6)-dimethyltransferase
MTLMFQKEVGQRIVAEPGSNHYGRLGVLAGWLTHSDILFDVPPQAFHAAAESDLERGAARTARRPLPCDSQSSSASPMPPSASAARCCARA